MVDQNEGGRSAKGAGMFDPKFWLMIVVIAAVIAVGGVFLS